MSVTYAVSQKQGAAVAILGARGNPGVLLLLAQAGFGSACSELWDVKTFPEAVSHLRALQQETPVGQRLHRRITRFFLLYVDPLPVTKQ